MSNRRAVTLQPDNGCRTKNSCGAKNNEGVTRGMGWWSPLTDPKVRVFGPVAQTTPAKVELFHCQVVFAWLTQHQSNTDTEASEFRWVGVHQFKGISASGVKIFKPLGGFNHDVCQFLLGSFDGLWG